ncbi:MAG: tetratricopeptide repeat protein [Elusimicrobiota bacterium]|nr:tetratricopeptide repeat protein [Elusimicrobiota bacterium]
MKKMLTIMFLIQSAAITALTPVLAAEPLSAFPGVPEVTGAAAEKKVNVRFRNISLPEFFKYVSRETGLTFRLADPELNTVHTTIYMKDSSISALMEIFVKSKSLEFQRDPQDGAYLVKRAKKPAVFPPLTRKELEDPLLQRVVNKKVRLKEVALANFLDTVSEQTKINFIITGDTPDIRVTTELNNTTVVDILQFLKSRGLEYSRITDTSLFIVRPAGDGAERFSKAETAFNEKKYEDSAALYREIAGKNPDSDMADYALLMSAVSYDWLAARDNSPAALKSEEEALRALIMDYPASSRLGDAYLYLGQIYSGHAGAAIKDIDCKKALGFYALAIEKTYRDWVKAQAEVRMGQCYERAGDRLKALVVYKEAARKYPDEEIVKSIQPLIDGQKTLLNAGIELENSGEYELAVRIYETVLKKDPGSDTAREAARRIEICKSGRH